MRKAVWPSTCSNERGASWQWKSWTSKHSAVWSARWQLLIALQFVARGCGGGRERERKTERLRKKGREGERETEGETERERETEKDKR